MENKNLENSNFEFVSAVSGHSCRHDLELARYLQKRKYIGKKNLENWMNNFCYKCPKFVNNKCSACSLTLQEQMEKRYNEI